MSSYMTNEKLNIISESATSSAVSGPRKVFENTCKGLEEIGQPYVVNEPMSRYRWNWVHDSIRGVLVAGFSGIPIVAGPNIVVMPGDLPKIRAKFSNSLYLHPSDWVVRLWKEAGFTECELASWPAGIDCNEFSASNKIVPSKKVMIYFKERHSEILTRTVQKVLTHGLEPIIIKYGHYEEHEFKRALKEALFGIWIGRHESQGIALQEALASNVPLLVLDATRFSDNVTQNTYPFPEQFTNFRTTSAPYFDSTCGIIIDEETGLDTAIKTMLQDINSFEPRNYVLKELSLAASARKMVEFLKRTIDGVPQRAPGSFVKYTYAEMAAKVSLRADRVLRRFAGYNK